MAFSYEIRTWSSQIVTYHVSKAYVGVVFELLHERVIMCREEGAALDTLRQLLHDRTSYGRSVIGGRAPPYKGSCV